VRQVQVILTFHDVVGELVADCITQAIRLAIVANDVEAAELGLFAGVFGERWQRERLTRPNDDAAVALVEPLRLYASLPRARFTALHAPFEDAHGVGHGRFVTGVLMHFVPCRGAAQMGQARAADEHVRRVRVIQRRQDAQRGEQFGVVVADAQAQSVYLLLQICAGFDGGQCQIANGVCVLDFPDQTALDDADAALAVT
jgi:hypothetical protein